MLVVQGWLEHRQAIAEIGVQRFELNHAPVEPTQDVQAMPIAPYRALLDTGAQRTCLTHRAIGLERLQRHGKHLIKNVHSENVHSLFMVKLGFWCDSGVGSRSYYGLENPIEIINIADNERFDAIVGMDVLSRFDVHFLKSGEFRIELA